jgi:hypothetical protein
MRASAHLPLALLRLGAAAAAGGPGGGQHAQPLKPLLHINDVPPPPPPAPQRHATFQNAGTPPNISQSFDCASRRHAWEFAKATLPQRRV